MNRVVGATVWLALAGALVLGGFLAVGDISVPVALGGIVILYGLRFITERIYYRHFYVHDLWRKNGHSIKYQYLVEDRIRNEELMKVLSDCATVLIGGDQYTINRFQQALPFINSLEDKCVRNACPACLIQRGLTPPDELLADATGCAFCGSKNDIVDVDLLALYDGLGLNSDTIWRHLPRYRRLVGRGDVDHSWTYIGQQIRKVL